MFSGFSDVFRGKRKGALGKNRVILPCKRTMKNDILLIYLGIVHKLFMILCAFQEIDSP